MEKAQIWHRSVEGLSALLLVALCCFSSQIPSVLASTLPIPDPTPAIYPDPVAELRFLNATNATQQKAGTLTIGLGNDKAKLCLNANPNYPANDATNCISSWTTVRSGGATNALPLRRDNYFTSNRGYITLEPRFANQLYTVIARAAPGANSPTTALKAEDAGKTTNFAGVFSGGVKVTDGTYTSGKKLCLNDPSKNADLILDPYWGGSTSYGCISKWTDLFYQANGMAYVNLASTGTTPAAQPGQVAISNSVQFGSLQIGNPTSMPLSYTCGDGACNASETVQSCPTDCTVVVGLTSFTAYPGDARVVFAANSWPTSAAEDQRVIILRKKGSAPTGVPQNGVTYSVGSVIGDSTVVFTGMVYAHEPTESSDIWQADTAGITNGQRYFYVAYAANGSSRYSLGTPATSAVPNPPTAHVTLRVSPVSTANPMIDPLFGDGSHIFYQWGPGASDGYYVPGTLATIDTTLLKAGYEVTSVKYNNTQCLAGPKCSFVVTGDTAVTVNTSASGSGSGGRSYDTQL